MRQKKQERKIVLVFGTFDGLHDGHRFFLKQARRLGHHLIAAVATDEVVREIKKHSPAYPLHERLKQLKASGLVDEAVEGDTKLGNWSALKKYSPDIIALGYDQTKLERELIDYIQKKRLPLSVVKIDAYAPARFHSSLLN